MHTSAMDGGHDAVVNGYSPTHIYVADSWLMINVWCRISKERLRERWDRRMMVVKDQGPKTAGLFCQSGTQLPSMDSRDYEKSIAVFATGTRHGTSIGTVFWYCR